MKFLANENFPFKSIKILRNEGYDVHSVSEKYSGFTDKKIMEISISESRTILTFDRDYGELIYLKGLKPPCGVVYFRLKNFKPEEPAIILVKIIKLKILNFENRLTVLDRYKIRQRSYL